MLSMENRPDAQVQAVRWVKSLTMVSGKVSVVERMHRNLIMSVSPGCDAINTTVRQDILEE